VAGHFLLFHPAAKRILTLLSCHALMQIVPRSCRSCKHHQKEQADELYSLSKVNRCSISKISCIFWVLKTAEYENSLLDNIGFDV
jgi:hypothetical protein